MKAVIMLMDFKYRVYTPTIVDTVDNEVLLGSETERQRLAAAICSTTA